IEVSLPGRLDGQLHDRFERSGMLRRSHCQEAVTLARWILFVGRSEARETIRSNLHSACGGEAEVVTVWKRRVQHAALIPARTIVFRPEMEQVRFFDDVM